ncbi:PREDICTED: Down syndrome critical region protein 3 isoform X2 [Erythranthe guttata]|uniref:Down syndrome critical region protein 3 isoform X2 n=1 Tax=Erythranthe guttata TaxID=4155 RepID=UPI00064DE744|nr:PREDICTED: Down syndrome critical region protein 3 isoform X2 [Erythranthe guttata]|eukprot:XP_012853259.1 PREDICTED: Down syndrome critical region protein 3 isoform X2 [Erythranthe guttata]
MSIEIKLSRFNRIYRPDEILEGKLIARLTSAISYQSIRLTVNGTVNLQVRGGSAGVVESLYGVIKPIPIVKKVVDVRSSGKIGSDTIFCDPKRPEGRESGKVLRNLPWRQYQHPDVVRGYLHKSLSATTEFIVESEKDNLPQKPVSPETVIFYITQDTQKHALLPELKSGGFRVTGKICTQCSLVDPLVGELTVEKSAIPIQSTDIHLLRVESILIGDRISTESTLMQTTQIADGDVCRGLTLPIYIILPRLLTCPTIFAGPFSIEFKVSIVITFLLDQSKKHKKVADPKAPKSWVAMESVPLELVRTM